MLYDMASKSWDTAISNHELRREGVGASQTLSEQEERRIRDQAAEMEEGNDWSQSNGRLD